MTRDWFAAIATIVISAIVLYSAKSCSDESIAACKILSCDVGYAVYINDKLCACIVDAK